MEREQTKAEISPKFLISKKIDAITGISEKYYGTVLPAPKSVKLELSGRCNYECTFCARRKGAREYKDMEWSTYTRLALEMREAGVEELGLFYLGEPFTDKRLPDAVKYAKDIGFPYVFVTTNGSLSSYGKVKKCMEAGLNSLKFSFNYADEEQFKSIARVKPLMWYNMLRNIKDARTARDEVFIDTGHWCGLFLSYIEFDGEQGEKIRELTEEFKQYVDEVYALPLYTMGARCTNDDKAIGWKPTPGNRGRAGNLRDPLPCWSAFTEGHITCGAKLNICCFDQPDLIAADLNEVSFMDGWNSEYFQRIRLANLAKDVTGTPCEKCVLIQQWDGCE